MIDANVKIGFRKIFGSRTVSLCALYLVLATWLPCQTAAAKEQRGGVLVEVAGPIYRLSNARISRMKVLDPFFRVDAISVPKRATCTLLDTECGSIFKIVGPGLVKIRDGSIRVGSRVIKGTQNENYKKVIQLETKLFVTTPSESGVARVCVARTPFRLALPTDIAAEPHANQVVLYYQDLSNKRKERTPMAAFLNNAHNRWWLDLESSPFHQGHTYSLWVGIPPNNSVGAFLLFALTEQSLKPIYALEKEANSFVNLILLIEACRKLHFWSYAQSALSRARRSFSDEEYRTLEAELNESQKVRSGFISR